MRRLLLAAILICVTCSIATARDTYLTDAIKKPAYMRSLSSLIESAGKLPSWTRQVLKTSGDYVGTPVTYSTIEGTRYELFNTCQAHDCTNNAMALMFAPKGAKAWGAIVIDAKAVTYLGKPDAAQQAALKRAFATSH